MEAMPRRDLRGISAGQESRAHNGTSSFSYLWEDTCSITVGFGIFQPSGMRLKSVAIFHTRKEYFFKISRYWNFIWFFIYKRKSSSSVLGHLSETWESHIQVCLTGWFSFLDMSPLGLYFEWTSVSRQVNTFPNIFLLVMTMMLRKVGRLCYMKGISRQRCISEICLCHGHSWQLK